MAESRYKPAFWLALGLLLVSLVAHALRGAREPALSATSCAPEASTPAPAATVATAASAATPANSTALTSCQTRLAKCQRQSWKLVARAIERQAPQQPAADGKAAAVESHREVTPDALLCEIATQGARILWKQQEPSLLAAMSQVGSEASIKQEVARKLAAHRRRHALPSEMSERLERGYRTLWQQHGAEMQRHIGGKDYRSLIGAAQAFWRHEDKLVRDVLGPSHAATYRRSDMRARVAITAIVASLGNIPWAEVASSL